MTFSRISALSIAIAALAACGGSGGGTTVVGPTTPTEPTTQDVARADVASASVFTDWNTAGDTRTVVRTLPTNGAQQTIALSAEDVDPLDGSAFTSYSNADSGARWRLLEATGPGGATVRVTGFVNDNVNLSYSPQSEYLTTGGSIPLSGTANFSGDYAGMLSRTTAATNPRLTDRYVTGDVSITADFGSERLDGRISNRAAFVTSNDSESFNLADVTLNSLNLTGGRSNTNFGAATTGGAIQATGYNTQSSNIFGNWSAAVTGTEAEAIVGAVNIFHDYTGGAARDLTETGVFVTTRD